MGVLASKAPWEKSLRVMPRPKGSGVSGKDQAGAMRHHLDDLVAELPKDDDDPGGRVVVLRGGPDEADRAQHLDDEPGELG